jgi:hypothetical protein
VPVTRTEVIWRQDVYALPGERTSIGCKDGISNLHTRVVAFGPYVRDPSSSPADEELGAAKFGGRWASGAPLALAPERDDPELGVESARNNAAE